MRRGRHQRERSQPVRIEGSQSLPGHATERQPRKMHALQREMIEDSDRILRKIGDFECRPALPADWPWTGRQVVLG